MHLHDTATGTLRPFAPAGGEVRLYVCGITPYDSAHLGHAFTYHVFDVLTRRLRAAGHSVRSVRNITDVDDDILRVARLRGADYRAMGDECVRRFDASLAALRVLPVDAAPRATEHVPLMVEWVERLVRNGCAYENEGWVYFDTVAFPEFGSLSRLDRPEMVRLSGERGADIADRRKRDPLDFVLWQRSADGEPSWPSPWGAGRPGWHIECSALSGHELGHPIDVHGGGEDLVFPHHECEAAQAAAAGVNPFVRHWMHVALVFKDGEKMSKSLGNLVFIDELLRRTPGAAARILLAQHHYREPWELLDEDVVAANDRWARYEVAMSSATQVADDEAQDVRSRFLARLDDDLDTPGALAVLDEAAIAWSPGHGAGARTAPAGAVATAVTVLEPLLGLLGATP